MASRPDSHPAGPQDFSFLNQSENATDDGSQGLGPAPALGPAEADSPPVLIPATADAPAPVPVPAKSKQTTRPAATAPTSAAGNANVATPPASRQPAWLPGYAIAVTLLLIVLAITGRITLFPAAHTLESLPDVRPLQPGEFQIIPPGTPLPPQHGLKLNQSQRFGDVVLTPLKVTREPISFEHFQTHAAEPRMTTAPVLKLWLKFENVSADCAFLPLDTTLMSHRYPEFATDETTQANSGLNLTGSTDAPRILNYLHPAGSNFLLTGQNVSTPVNPGQSVEVYVASAELPELELAQTSWTWRIQFRKGIHQPSGHGVTTLVDVSFDTSEITQ